MSVEAQQPQSSLAAPPAEPADASPARPAPLTDDEVAGAAERLTFGRRRRRHPLVSVAVIALSLYLMVRNRHDLRFFLAPRAAIDLGDTGVALRQRPELLADRYVQVAGVPDRKHALLLEGKLGPAEHFYRLLGAGDQLYVCWPRPAASGAPGEDRLIPALHRGRLVPLARLPYAGAVRDYLARTMSVAHDFDFAPLYAASTRGAAAAVDRNGRSVALRASTIFWLNVAYADEWIVQLPRRNFPRAEQAAALLARLALPHIADTEASPNTWRYVVVARGLELQLLLQALRDEPAAGALLRRQVGYTARWDQLRWEADAVTLAIDDATAPPRHELGPALAAGGPARLVARRGGPLRFLRSELLYLSTSTPFAVPGQAMVVLAGATPGQQWPNAALQLLLLVFIGANAWVLLRAYRARRPRPS